MKKYLLIIGLVIGLCIAGFASTAAAEVLDFEDLHPGREAYGRVPDGYAGFIWNHASFWITKNYLPNTGFEHGTVGTVSLFTGYTDDVSLKGEVFNFNGAYISAAWDVIRYVTVEGWRDGVQLYSTVITTSNNGAHWFDFDFQGIDTLVFRPRGSHIVIDNLTFSTPNTVLIAMIDVKPGSDKNPINLTSRGVTPVAVLTTDTLYAPSVDPATVVLGPSSARPVSAAFEDVDGDGDYDLLLHFRTQEIGLTGADTDVTLSGLTFEGQSIEGSDGITIVKKGKDK